MKKEIALEWAAALRSGKFKQGKLWLNYKCQDYICPKGEEDKDTNEDGIPDWVDKCVDLFSSCGVLCKILENRLNLKKEVFLHRYQENRDIKEFNIISYDGLHTTIPSAVKNFAEIKNENFNYDSGMLVKDNDNGTSFEEIANLIEKHYEKL